MNEAEFAKILKDIAENVFTDELLDLSHDTEGDQNYNAFIKDAEAIRLASALKRNLYITKLNLSHNKIGDEGAIALARVLILEELNVFDNNITPLGATALAKNFVIKKLSIGCNPINCINNNDIPFQNMMNSFYNNPIITELDLSFTSIPDKVIAELINKNNIITKLKLPRNVSDFALKSIMTNTTIVDLEIFESLLTDKGAYYLSKNSSLKTLYIGSSNIGDKGVEFLCHHPSLQKLKLYNSNISIKGTNYFYSSNIEEVNLFNPTKHEFISYDELCQFNSNFQYYKQKMIEEQTIQLYTIEQHTTDLMGDSQDEG